MSKTLTQDVFRVVFILSLLINVKAFGQKIKPYNYKNVDTVNKYKDAETIIYKDKNGKSKTDTIYYKKQKADINIESAEVVNIFDEPLKPKNGNN